MKERLTRNLGMKIISLIIAVVLWIIINGLTDPVTTEVIEDIPVRLINEEAMESVGKIFEVLSGDSITVKVRAKRSVAESLSTDDFLAVADVTKMSEMHAVEIVVSCLKYGESEVEILSKQTKDGTGMMMLSLEDSDTQSFAVSVVPDGSAADGYYITESQVSPNLITITGSKTQIAKIAKIAVLVNVNGAAASFIKSGTPVVYDENGNVVDMTKISLSSEQVQVSVTLLPTKRIDINVVKVGEPFYNYDCTGIEFAPSSIVIAGQKSSLDKVTQLELGCNISNAREDVEAELSIEEALQQAYGDEYILVDEIDRVSAKAAIERMESKEITILTSSIEVRNLAENLDVVFDDVTKNLKVVAVPQVLNTITSATLNPYIDCAEYEKPGTYFTVIRTQEAEERVKLTTIQIEIIEKDVAAQQEVTEES